MCAAAPACDCTVVLQQYRCTAWYCLQEQDSYHSQRTSTTFMSLVNVLAVSEQPCGLRLRVVNRTSSGGHKWKVGVLTSTRHLLECGAT